MEEMMRISGENDAHQWRKSSASVEKVIRITEIRDADEECKKK